MFRTLLDASRVHSRLAAAGLAIIAFAVVALVGFQMRTPNVRTALADWNGAPLAPDTCTWTGTTSANWSTLSNWSGCTNGGLHLPRQIDSVIIPALDFDGDPVVITSIPGALQIGGLTIAAGSQSLTGDPGTSDIQVFGGNVSIGSGASYSQLGFSFRDGVAFTGPATITNAPVGFSGDVDVVSNVTFTGSASVFDAHTITLDDETQPTLTFTQFMSGDLVVDGVGDLELDGGGVNSVTTDEGVSTTFDDGGVTLGAADFGGPVTVAHGVTVTLPNPAGTLAFNGSSDIAGTIQGTSHMDMIMMMFAGTGTIVNHGDMTLADGGTFTSVASFTNDADHTITVDPGAGKSAVVSVQYPFIATFLNNGAISVDSGTFNVTAALSNGANSSINTALLGAGGVAGADFSQLSVTGNVTWGGSISVDASALTDATPVDKSYPVIHYGGSSGTAPARYGGQFGNGGYVTVDAPATNDLVARTHRASSTVSPTTVARGGSVTINVTGYGATEEVHAFILGPNVQSDSESGAITLAKVTTNSAGAGSLTLPIPAATTLGEHMILIDGQTTGVRLAPKVTVITADADGDGILDGDDCAPNDKAKPLQTKGAVDKDCNGVDDAIQPIKFIGIGTKNDKVIGKGGPDVIKTGAGNDVVASGGGNDKVDGGPGNDKIDAGAGDDTAAGGAGNDKVKGGAGKDKMSGGSGNDSMDAKDGKAGDTVSCGAGKDTVIADKKDKVSKDCEKVIRK